MMPVLVTGAAGFVGRNLVESLRRQGDLDVRTHDLDGDRREFEQ